MSDNMDWVDKQEEKRKEERSKEYFNINEGDNRFVLLSECAPLAQVFDGKKYRIAEEGDDPKKINLKGVCWVYQEGMIKSAKLPYTVVKAIRGLQQNPDWEFRVPFPHVLNLAAKNAGTKEVEYTLTPSPKEVEIPKDILDELANKPTAKELVEKIKGKSSGSGESTGSIEYPKEDDINPDDIPF